MLIATAISLIVGALWWSGRLDHELAPYRLNAHLCIELADHTTYLCGKKEILWYERITGFDVNKDGRVG